MRTRNGGHPRLDAVARSALPSRARRRREPTNDRDLAAGDLALELAGCNAVYDMDVEETTTEVRTSIAGSRQRTRQARSAPTRSGLP